VSSRVRSLSIGAFVFAVAFCARLLPVLLKGSLSFYNRYDDGVYYAAADALSFGRMPYRDYVLLHPPGIALALLPFAVLGRMTSDATGLIAGRIAIMAVGAASAVVVTRIAARWGSVPSVIAGLGYAFVWPAVYTERTTSVEPIPDLLVLLALLIVLGRRGDIPYRRLVAAGALLGLATCFKAWFAVPLLIVAVWSIAARSRGRLGAPLAVLGGALGVAIVVVGPFFAAAPVRLMHYVIRDQLRRTAHSTPRPPRVPAFLGVAVHYLDGRHAARMGPDIVTATLLFLVALGLAAIGCLVTDSFRRDGVLLVTWLVVDAGVLVAAPVYFAHYGTFVSSPEVLVLAVGLTELARRLLGDWTRWAALAVALVVVAAIGARGVEVTHETGLPIDALTSAAPPGCVTSDSPVVLELIDRLSTDLRDHCRVPVDVTGISYDLNTLTVDGDLRPRREDRIYQRHVYRYIVSGTSFVLVDKGGDQLGRRNYHRLGHMPLLVDADGIHLRAVPAHLFRDRPVRG